MEFLKANFLNTSTGFVVNSATGTAENVMNPDLTFQFVSSGMNDDNTTVSMRYNFSQTMTVQRIALGALNAKEFRLFYDGATANAFVLTSTGATVSSAWNANSETAMYLRCTSVYCTSVTLEMKKTMVANAEKAIGYFAVSEVLLELTRIPAAKNYQPMLNPEEVQHKLSDGNVRVQNIANRWSFDIKLEYVTEAQRNSLRTLYDRHDGMIFCPFGTTTAWDKVIAPVVWPGAFNFYKFSDNAVGTGFEGAIKLFETTP